MKKFLIVLCLLLVAGGAFAHEPIWLGEVVMVRVNNPILYMANFYASQRCAEVDARDILAEFQQDNPGYTFITGNAAFTIRSGMWEQVYAIIEQKDSYNFMSTNWERRSVRSDFEGIMSDYVVSLIATSNLIMICDDETFWVISMRDSTYFTDDIWDMWEELE